MSSKSTTVRNQRIAKTVAKYAQKRRELKEAGDYAALSQLPRDASPTRLRNLCALTGRSRGVYRKFKLSRIKLRELALEGKVPGMRKSSW
jgi:small subunit ribosomal protein S14